MLDFQVFTDWKGDALLAQQRAQALVGDVVDHPLGDQEIGQLRQAPDRERQVVIGRAGQRDLLDLRPLLEVELRRPAAGVAGIEGVEAVGV